MNDRHKAVPTGVKWEPYRGCGIRISIIPSPWAFSFAAALARLRAIPLLA